MDVFAYERQAHEAGYAVVCGVDEAGAGPLAGPVYAAAVVLPEHYDLPLLTDSKKLTEKRREALFEPIQQQALAWAVAFVDAQEIDRFNILIARMRARERAMHKLDPVPDFALIDGNRNQGITVANRMVVKGDSLSASISAASVLAKVSRDRYMLEMAQQYPQYQFERHKGYGTKLHYALLREFGPSPIHRRSFLKNL